MKQMKKSGKLYCYNFDCELVDINSDILDKSRVIVAVSEGKLPAPSKRFEDICCSFLPDVPNRIKNGSVINIAFGDPIVLRNCKLVTRSKKGVPEELITKVTLFKGNPIITLEYRGKKLWILMDATCLLSSLEEEKKILDKEKAANY